MRKREGGLVETRAEGERKMIERLGDVLYWTGTIFAVLLVPAGVAMAVVMIRTDNPTDLASARTSVRGSP